MKPPGGAKRVKRQKTTMKASRGEKKFFSKEVDEDVEPGKNLTARRNRSEKKTTIDLGTQRTEMFRRLILRKRKIYQKRKTAERRGRYCWERTGDVKRQGT